MINQNYRYCLNHMKYRVLELFILLVNCMLLDLRYAYAGPVAEIEPNDTNLQANVLLPGQFARGQILTGADFDVWSLPGVSTDQFYCIFLNALEATPASADPVLSVYFNGNSIDTVNSDAYNDDGGPPAEAFDDSVLCGEPVKRAGALLARADGFGSATLDPYTLYPIVIGPNEVLPEVEPNDSALAAMPIQSAAIAADLGEDADFFSFHAEAGQPIVVMLDQDPGRPTPTTAVDAGIQIFDSDGLTDISESVPGEHLVDPEPGATIARAYGVLPAPHAGTFYVRISKRSGDSGDYRIIVLVNGDTPRVGACCTAGVCTLATALDCHGKFGGAGSICDGDDDTDGLPNACDNCQSVANNDPDDPMDPNDPIDLQKDKDSDDFGDVCDACPLDGLKINPGACGCGTLDTDTDGDGTADCNDQCPVSSNEVIPGACGCGVAESDRNNNGVFDCQVGTDLKSLLQNLVTQVNALKTSKVPSKAQAETLRNIVAQAQGVLTTSAAQITLTQSGIDLQRELGALTTALDKALKSKGGKLAKNKKATNRIAQKLIAAIA